ncbi:DUF4233 domain-containing protein [Actinobacteria bacterium YIM 96077]|uniref:DUF4233 domain-containing protein n=1 Tax=Phytoactinopolyspora halophila TaxID=1981511 RepID=A0A329R1W9_9ACTN|nr:DUF4233 domain-containing protein [Phytoactinopolyspora halophila]AYY12210.1 DUF4233 domain-containing protein [Actinobacteria bacterium YIM 96077]RAW18557.1 DUF4233 domain-containing protein [Phytoactinopolyspora halophila]
MNRIAATILGAEAFVVVLAVPVALNVADVATAPGWIGATVIALLCLLGIGMVRRGGRAGYVLGSVVQVGMLALGFILPMMFVLGAIFAALWLLLLRLGPDVEAAKRNRENTGVREDRDD